jgi:hypothetical protein
MPADIQDALALHIEASAQLEKLVSECKRLHDTGKVSAARRVMRQIDEIKERPADLKHHFRLKR